MVVVVVIKVAGLCGGGHVRVARPFRVGGEGGVWCVYEIRAHLETLEMRARVCVYVVSLIDLVVVVMACVCVSA